jgi:hypothetical protein
MIKVEVLHFGNMGTNGGVNGGTGGAEEDSDVVTGMGQIWNNANLNLCHQQLTVKFLPGDPQSAQLVFLLSSSSSNLPAFVFEFIVAVETMMPQSAAFTSHFHRSTRRLQIPVITWYESAGVDDDRDDGVVVTNI